MDKTVPPHITHLWLRLLSIAVGIFTLFWLPIEDSSETTVIIIAVLIVCIFSLNIINKGKFNEKPILHAIIGAISGALIIPLSLFLVAFKTSLHQHGIPEFSIEQIIFMLHKIPYFVLAGLLIGFGNVIWQTSRKSNT